MDIGLNNGGLYIKCRYTDNNDSMKIDKIVK